MSQSFTSHFSFGAATNFVSNGAFTFCGWINITPTPVNGGDAFYMETAGSGSSSHAWVGFLGTGFDSQLYFEQATASGTVTIKSAWTLGAWIHLAMTMDASGNLRAYVNGAQVGSTTAVPGVGTRANFDTSDVGIDGAGTGHIQDAMAFSGVALSALQIQEVMRRRIPPNISGAGSLYIWWPLFNDQPLRDFSGNGHTLDSTFAAGTTFPANTWGGQNGSALRVFLAASGAALVGAAGTGFGAVGTLAVADALVGAAGTGFGAVGALAQAQALTGAAGTGFGAVGTLAQLEALAGNAGTGLGATGTLAQVVGLAGNASNGFGATGALAQLQALSGSAGSGFGASGALVQLEALTGSAGTGFGATGSLSQNGLFVGTASTGFGAVGALTQLEALTGAAGTGFGATGSLSVPGTNSLAGSASNGFGATGDLAQLEALIGSAATGSGAVGTLAQLEALAGSASFGFGALGLLAQNQALSGAAGTGFGASGTLSGGTSPVVGGGGHDDTATRRYLGALTTRRKLRR